MLQLAAPGPADRAVPEAGFPYSVGSEYSLYACLPPIAPLTGNGAVGSCRQRSEERADFCRNPQRPLSDRTVRRKKSPRLDREIGPAGFRGYVLKRAAIRLRANDGIYPRHGNGAHFLARIRLELHRKAAQLRLHAPECIAEIG